MPRKLIRVVAAVVDRCGHYLITQRREQAVLGLMWEFPGGMVEPGESDEDALVRELRERLDAQGIIGKKIGERHHVYDSYDVDFALYSVTIDPAQKLYPKHVKDFRWVASGDFEQYNFPDADQATMDQLLNIKGD